MAQPLATLLVPDRVFDGEAIAPPGSCVLVEGGRVRAIDSYDCFSGFAGETLYLPGATLTPGLIDCHVHLCFGSEPDVPGVLRTLNDAQVALKAAENARATLSGGVTTVRDLGGVRGADIALRDNLQRGMVGPHLVCSGRFICMTGGHGCWAGVEADGTDSVMKAVRDVIKLGADWVKVIATGGVLTRNTDPLKTQFRNDELEATITEAKRLGRKVAVHAHGADAVGKAVIAGADSIEHGFQLTEEVIADMIARQVYLVPTFSAVASILEHALGLDAEMVDKASRYAEMHVASVRAFAAAGGKIAMGTDAGTPFNLHGENAKELLHMVMHGLSAQQALQSSTSIAANLLGLSDRGRIVPGAIADLLIVSGDPLADMSRIAERRYHLGCMRAGRLVAGTVARELAVRNPSALSMLYSYNAA